MENHAEGRNVRRGLSLLVSRTDPVPGLVHLRQTFVRRCQSRTVSQGACLGAGRAAPELMRDRLQAALPGLRARYTEVRRQEDVTKWKAEAEKLAVRRDELRMEFSPRFCRSS